MRIYTIGHSTRTVEELVDALRSFGVRTLADIRTVPRSRRVPQFNRESLARTLPERGIRYHHVPALGGLRRPRSDSTNTAWRNASFRGFADYMQTAEFAGAVESLRRLARDEGPVAIMCAEAVPWRCHRSLVADALLARGDAVTDIMGPESGRERALTPWAAVEGRTVTYPGPPPESGQAAARPRRRTRTADAAPAARGPRPKTSRKERGACPETPHGRRSTR